MKYLRPTSISLRGLMLTFVLLAVMATLCNSLWVAYGVQRDALIHSRLEANRAYASKVASSIGQFLTSAHHHLGYSSHMVARDFHNPVLLKDEVVRLHAQDTDFNAVRVIDASGKVLQAYPDQAHLIGTTAISEEVQQALNERRPRVSHGYVTVTGNLIVFISNPIFSATGEFLGIIGASVFIREQGVLHTLIGNHFHHDGTFAFVADDNRRLLYHSDPPRIGEVLTSSPTVDAALRGENGAMDVPNSRGVQMLAGYAQVANANWAVVAQQPRELALAPLSKLMRDMLLNIVPAGLVGLGLILLGTLLITRPLQQLAKSANQLSAPQASEALRVIKAWYKEAAAIRLALLGSVEHVQQKIGSLSHAAQSDALTGLANRRAMDASLQSLDQSGRHYAVLALDIDHFKRVNDTFGHDVGDIALKQVAAIIERCSRAEDLACRAGGEEFVLVLPEASLEVASEIAERIRQTLAGTEIAQVGMLTISIGVACRSVDMQAHEAILKRADQRLYRAKTTGRNRVVADDAQTQNA